MFNPDFYPSPIHVIELLCQDLTLAGKTVLEPNAGKCDIVNYCLNAGATVIACENNADLLQIVKSKCLVVAEDFLTVESHQVSHIDYIIMNPPFSADEKHIMHAWNIAPAGCKIRAICNAKTYTNAYTSARKEFVNTVNTYGSIDILGEHFSDSERRTDVEVALVTLDKPGGNYENEFEGFFLGADEEEPQENGIMSYNVVRDLVNRYVAAIKLYDQHLELAVQMNELTHSHFFKNDAPLTMQVARLTVPVKRAEFKKSMQKAGWLYIFEKMNMAKYATKGLKEDINKFVEKQQHIPFTMRNIYHMLDIVVGTQSQRMDNALEEVFDRLTKHYDENRYFVEGWKTNSHYLVNQKFIMPNTCWQDQRWYKGQSKIQLQYGGNFDLLEDFLKALCYISGDKYEQFCDLHSFIRYRYKCVSREGTTCHPSYDGYDSFLNKKEELYKRGIPCEMIDCEPIYGQWFDWAYFRVKCFKKGTMHFEFKDLDLWGRFNQRIARIKGYPLFEPKPQRRAA